MKSRLIWRRSLPLNFAHVSCYNSQGYFFELQLTGASTVPRVFIGGHFLGGGDDTVAAHEWDQLRKVIKSWSSVFFKFVSCSQAKLFPENPNLTFLESLVEPLAFLLITFISYSFKTIKQLLKNANSLIAQNLVESLAFIFFLNLNVQEWRAGGQTEGGGSPALNWVLTWALL